MTADDARRIREKSGLSQGEFGKKIGKTRIAVNSWENGRYKMTETINLLYSYINDFGFDYENKVSNDINDYELVKSSGGWSCAECVFHKIDCNVPNKDWLELCNREGWIFKRRTE